MSGTDQNYDMQTVHFATAGLQGKVQDNSCHGRLALADGTLKVPRTGDLCLCYLLLNARYSQDE